MNEFWAKVARGAPNDCWEWVKGKDRDGYGLTRINGKQFRAHRLAMTLSGVLVRRGDVVMHSCDNPSCCNPAHLSVGSQAENLADMNRKGRARGGSFAGERNNFARLVASDVRSIRTDGRKYADIADSNRISISTVAAIKNNRIWKHI